MDENETKDIYDLAEFLNAEVGNDVTKLQDEQLLRKLDAWQTELEIKLTPNKNEFSQFVTFSEMGEIALQKISSILEKHENLQMMVRKQIATLKPVKDSFMVHLKSLTELENAHSYLQWLLAMESQNDLLAEGLKQNTTSETIAHFEIFKTICSKLTGSGCKNLVKYSEDTLSYWHHILKEKFASEFQKVLSSLHWPILFGTASMQLNPSPDTLMKFHNLFLTLHKIEFPEHYTISTSGESPSEYPPFLLPLQLMFEPLEKRFYFHFMGKKQTNRIDKPEWYLSQILTWISDHQSFLKNIVQPFLDEKNLDSMLIFDEFMRCLVQLCISRLRKDLPTLLDAEDELLSHTIDEIFLFERELDNQEYPKHYPSLLKILSTEPCFGRWKNLEHKSALEKMDRILNSESAWKSRYLEEEELDELLVPECAEMFITLMLTMTERYRQSLEEQHQICFMELQLELLDDFRLRLHQHSQYQVEETLDPKYCAILNAINYILFVLNEWSNLPFYLKMYTYMKQSNNPIESENNMKASPKKSMHHQKRLLEIEDEKFHGSVFDESFNLLEHMQKDLIQILCERVMLDIKAKSRGYRKEKWFCMATAHDSKLLEVSPFAYPLLDVINTSLQSLSELLAKTLFTMVWQNIAKELDLYLYEEVILQNSFSQGGAQQLNFDMTRNLFPIFGSCTLKPENYFRLVKESCILLNMSPAPAILLKEALKQPGKLEERITILGEQNVFNLSPPQALVILSQRNDTTT